MACRITEVSRSCYEHKYRVPSDREIRRLLVSGHFADIHKRSRGTYGMLRIRAALFREQGMVSVRTGTKNRIHVLSRDRNRSSDQ